MLVVGAGNLHRGDDGAGPAVARALRERLPMGIDVVEAAEPGAGLLDLWDAHDAVILIDATSSAAPAGTIVRLEAHDRPLPVGLLRLSTHAFGLAEVIELARALGRLPRQVVVYGIEGRSFAPGEGLTPEVARSVERVIQHVEREARSALQLRLPESRSGC